MKKYAHNAVSAESPSHFKGSFSLVTHNKPISLGKKLINQPIFHQDLPQRRACVSLPPINIDQDYDSIKFSNAIDVTSGIKDKIRYKSNFYQNFFEKMRFGFKKPKQEITFMNTIKKVIRESPSITMGLKYQKSTSKLFGSSLSNKIPESIDPEGRQLQVYESEISACKTPFSTNINFIKHSQQDLSTINKKIKYMLASTEIKKFEERLPKPSTKRGNLWYQQLISK
ncbi:hypothetical protein SteCoe_11012 [Stentor coeruleus]|uniref:Uncharacterized protein n=1 Tax=Stentor coeruleus TaxID=5963 RepID=A0A1R2CE82_9CILI|nr:hypothetical protein SteCoe_11012 [Stentor coeruleus]